MKVDVSYLASIVSPRPPGRTLETLDQKTNAHSLSLAISEDGTEPDSATSLYGLLESESGQKAARKFFLAQCGQEQQHTGYAALGHTPFGGPSAAYMSENQFLLLMRKLSSLSTPQILDLFDLFDSRDEVGYLGFADFFLILALFAARESAQCTMFQYRHGKELFDRLASPWANLMPQKVAPKGEPAPAALPPRVTAESLRRLVACTLDMRPSSIAAAFRDAGVAPTDALTQEEFSLVAFAIFRSWDVSKAGPDVAQGAPPAAPAQPASGAPVKDRKGSNISNSGGRSSGRDAQNPGGSKHRRLKRWCTIL